MAVDPQTEGFKGRVDGAKTIASSYEVTLDLSYCSACFRTGLNSGFGIIVCPGYSENTRVQVPAPLPENFGPWLRVGGHSNEWTFTESFGQQEAIIVCHSEGSSTTAKASFCAREGSAPLHFSPKGGPDQIGLGPQNMY